MIKKILFALLPFLLLTTVIPAQDLANIKNEKPIHISGSIGANYTATITNDSNRVPMPGFWNANANVNISIYGISIPLLAVVTNGSIDFKNSFSQFGLSPKYKNLTIHAGYRQYTYSPSTVSGQTFFGGGFDYRPKKLRLGFFIGRLHKARMVDTSLYSQTIPGSYPLNVSSVNGTNYYSQAGSFSRWGWGAKFGLGKETNFVDFILFKAHDRENSINDTFSLKKILPERNFVLGLNTVQKIGKHINVSGDAAVSAYTYNSYADSIPFNDDLPVLNLLQKLFRYNLTTQLQWAGNVNVGYTAKNFTLQTQYKHIEPYYKSMGNVSTYSDVELFSIRPSWSFFKKKLKFTNMFQTQHDNLNHYKQLTTKRIILNSSISVNPSTKWGFDVSYNNFGMKQEKINALVPDSISVSQKSNTYTFVPRYIFMTSKHTDVVSLVTSITNVKNEGQKNNSGDLNNFYATLNNTLAISKSGWSITSGLNYNTAKTLSHTMNSFGIIAGASKSLIKNTLAITNNNTLLWNSIDSNPNGNTVSLDLTVNYILLKKHNIGFGYNYVYSPANGIYNINDYSQSRLMFSYQYIFKQ
ncbi:MAG TPA: hypothetical protein PKK00_13125 [Bacteroidales bacterium]|nr:hypothetical protein [Bacteroidales bacterium]HPS17719.1 hypothetical protein [Bacteroidales bacterium]